MSVTKKKITRGRKKKIIEHPESSAVMFSNRELGWLNFNLRVLTEAADKKNPLLERIRFLAISSSNLDEFFMKRVGGLKRHVAYGISVKSSDGQTPESQLEMINKQLQPMLKTQKELYSTFVKDLKAEGCEIVDYTKLTEEERKFTDQYFYKNLFPVLTPLSVDPGHPFPFISNLAMSLGVSLAHPNFPEEKLFARIKIPQVIQQWIQIQNSNRWINIIDVITAHLSDLFPEMKIAGHILFRISRNADSDREEEDIEDLLAMIEEELRQRRFAEIVRLEIGRCTDVWLKEYLIQQLEVKDVDLFPMIADLDLTSLNELVNRLSLQGSFIKLKYPSWSPVVPHLLQDTTVPIFEIIKRGDLLLHHPYESFSASVERFVREASEDRNVLSIKMTLYRTGDNSPFIQSLIRAAELGKQVVCLIELKARFDEERNIYWAQELENAGVHVVYGVVGLKTHAKTCLIVRQENQQLVSYAHLGTGNYNVSTSRFYTDIGLLTCDERITNELMDFFNYLTGKSLKQDYKHLILAPVNMFTKMKELIAREKDHAVAKRPALIMAKFNNMEENDISLSLYQASKLGVSVQLMVRGFCCLRPETKGFSENIHVQSTIGRFLEHSRIFYFRNGQIDPVDGEFFIGSADWMYRNLHARVESICPIYDRAAKEKLWHILQAYWQDDKQTWSMRSDAAYEKKTAKTESLGVQNDLMVQAKNSLVITEEDLAKEVK